MPHQICFSSRIKFIFAACALSSSTLFAQPRETKPTPEPPLATEVLRIRPTYVLSTGEKHGYGRFLARAEVLSVGSSSSGLRRGSSILIVFGYKGFRYGRPTPVMKGKIYRALLVRDPRATTEKREPIYRPTNGFKSFQLLNVK